MTRIMTNATITFTDDMKLWTLAYRPLTTRRDRWDHRIPTGRFRRVADWAGTWQEARDMAARITTEIHGRYQVWVVTTRRSEMVGHTHPDDIGNIMVELGRRVAMVDGGTIRTLVPDVCTHLNPSEVGITDSCDCGCKIYACDRCGETWTGHSRIYGCRRPDAC